MLDYLFSPEFMPFTLSLALLLGLTVLELAALLIGMSFLGGSADADVDADLDGVDAGAGGLEASDLGDVDLDGVDFDGADLEGLDLTEIDGIQANDATAPAVAARKQGRLGLQFTEEFVREDNCCHARRPHQLHLPLQRRAGR